LAARGAQRALPGLITVFPQENVYQSVAAQVQAAMARPFDPGSDYEHYSAVLIGPGLASRDLPNSLRSLLGRLWTTADQPVIVDASALDWLPPKEPVPRDATRVVTPHPGEAARLLKCRVADVQANRVRAVRELSERFGGCWVLLKGHQTLVGRQEGPVVVNCSGNPALAQGGAGDVLAGYVAGLLAQPVLQGMVPAALRYAVWQHGATADLLARERPNWVVEDFLQSLGGVVPLASAQPVHGTPQTGHHTHP
jgi:ADP-dependent NAD(P)H-hydrate dehydratase / NAD(P)H-hydrate epimerase